MTALIRHDQAGNHDTTDLQIWQCAACILVDCLDISSETKPQLDDVPHFARIFMLKLDGSEGGGPTDVPHFLARGMMAYIRNPLGWSDFETWVEMLYTLGEIANELEPYMVAYSALRASMRTVWYPVICLFHRLWKEHYDYTEDVASHMCKMHEMWKELGHCVGLSIRGERKLRLAISALPACHQNCIL
ncbi:hypothetical protein OF83DRAFT_1089523 [Amylostereum chailletii]|nr:hypothetical protein OF83DRAFT_1089523 [Amylostereum chailletii]